MLDTLTVSKAISLSIPHAKRLFKKIVSPYVEEKVITKFKSRKAYSEFKSNAEKYLADVAGQCSVINTIAFQNAPKKLADLYMPLTLLGEASGNKIIVDDDCDVFDFDNRVLLVDNAGMGKSTISKKIIINVVNNEIEGIPIYFEMRRLTESSLVTQIGKKLGLVEDVCSSVLKELPLVCVFDGVDETPEKLQINAIEGINEFSNCFPNAKVVITSRNEIYLSEFHTFSRYSINKLTKAEAFDLIRKYDPEELFSEKLINDIDSSSKEIGIHEFLSTPLYVSLLFCAYRHKSVVPRKRSLFYAQVYDALFESHDLSKEVGFIREKASGLDSSNFHAVLRRLGFWCLKNEGRLNFKRDELEITIKTIIDEMSEIETSTESYVKDLITSVPLFVKEGAVVGWSHKSLMEYFAAMFICSDVKDRQEEVLLKLYKADSHGKFLNIIDLCSDIDYSGFKFSIGKHVFDEYIDYCANSYCNIGNKRVKEDWKKIRRGLSFSTNTEFSILSNKDGIDKDWFNKHLSPIMFGDSKRSFKLTGFHNDGGPFSLVYIYDHGLARRILPIIKRVEPSLFINIDRDVARMDKIHGSSLRGKFFYKIEDDPNILINNSANFPIVNDILALNSPYALDEDKVRKSLECMEKDKTDGIGALLKDF